MPSPGNLVLFIALLISVQTPAPHTYQMPNAHYLPNGRRQSFSERSYQDSYQKRRVIGWLYDQSTNGGEEAFLSTDWNLQNILYFQYMW